MQEIQKIALSKSINEWQILARNTSDLNKAFYYNALKRLAEALQAENESEIETWTFNAEELENYIKIKELEPKG